MFILFHTNVPSPETVAAPAGTREHDPVGIQHPRKNPKLYVTRQKPHINMLFHEINQSSHPKLQAFNNNTSNKVFPQDIIQIPWTLLKSVAKAFKSSESYKSQRNSCGFVVLKRCINSATESSFFKQQSNPQKVKIYIFERAQIQWIIL